MELDFINRCNSNRMGDLKIYYPDFLCALEGMISCWSRLHLHSLIPFNLHWSRVERNFPCSLTIYKESLCPCSGDIKMFDDDRCNYFIIH